MYKASAYINQNQKRPWTQGSADAKPKKQQKSGLKKAMVLPLFEKCAESCSDPTWSELFHKAAVTGKFPNGFLFKDGKLFYKHRKIIKFIDLSNLVDPTLECMDFIEKNIGEISSTKRKETPKSEHAKAYDFESELRKKNKLRDGLVYQFIQTDFRKRYSLTPEQVSGLLYTVIIGFMSDTLTNDDIVVDNNKIVCLGGIDMDHFTLTGKWRINHTTGSKKKRKTAVCLKK
jgi:hypothetical protein